MNDQRKSGFSRSRNVRAKSPLLGLTRRSVIIIVEAGLADRHHFVTATGGHKFGETDVSLLMRVVRMRADRAINLGKAAGDREECSVPPHAGRYRDHLGN